MRAALIAFLAFVAIGVQAGSDRFEGLKDPSWPRRAAAFLESQHGVSQADWLLLSQGRKEQLFLDWAKQREQALQARRIVMLQGKPPTEAQARQLRLLAEGGFLNDAEVRSLGALRTAGGAALFEAAAIEPSAFPAAARADAARQFRQGSLGSRSQSVFTQAPVPGLAPTSRADLEVAFRAAQQMVLDPEGFEKSRPELFKGGSTAAERASRGRLRQQLGHLFAAANRLRAADRLEFRLGSEKEMEGAFGETEITEANDHWKIIVRLHEKYRNADPALLAPTLVHELQHAHNDARRIERYGLAVAKRLDDSQEEEQRAFIAESHLAPAYASAFRLARAGDAEGDADLHSQIDMLSSLEEARLQDALRYRARLKDAAYSLLRRNDYLKGKDSLQDLTALRRKTEQELKKAAAQPTQEAKAVELRSLLRLIDEEKKRGLDIL